MTDTLPEHRDMVDAIVDAVRSADDAQHAAGIAWYPAAGAIARGIAEAWNVDASTAARVMAALSPRNPWRWNVADAWNVIAAAHRGQACPSVTTFGANRAQAWSIATGLPVTYSARGRDNVALPEWRSAAPKVRAFVAAILGDASSIVVDVWAVRAATPARIDAVTRAQYGHVAAAYAAAALELGIDARDVQAIAWIVTRDAVAAGQHYVTWKRGTDPRVLELAAAA